MRSDMVVVGGGAVAAAAVLAAEQHNLRVRHIAAVPYQCGGRHYALSRRSVDFLYTLGVKLTTLPVTQFVLRAGTRYLPLADGGKPLCQMVAEEQLMQALTARLNQAGVATTYGDIRYGSSDGDTVNLTVDGSDLHTRLLVVADGARSPLAQQLGIYGEMTDFHQQAVVAQVHAPTLAAHTALQWFGDNDIVALLPAEAGVFSLVWSTAAPPAPGDVASALRQRIAIDDLSIVADSVRTFPLRALTRAARVAPRTALIGDAAGVIHPLAGQGLNLGLADAQILLQCVHRRINSNTSIALAAYSWARTRRHRQLQQVTQFLLPQRARTSALLNIVRLPILQRLAVAFANA